MGGLLQWLLQSNEHQEQLPDSLSIKALVRCLFKKCCLNKPCHKYVHVHPHNRYMHIWTHANALTNARTQAPIPPGWSVTLPHPWNPICRHAARNSPIALTFDLCPFWQCTEEKMKCPSLSLPQHKKSPVLAALPRMNGHTHTNSKRAHTRIPIWDALRLNTLSGSREAHDQNDSWYVGSKYVCVCVCHETNRKNRSVRETLTFKPLQCMFHIAKTPLSY